MRSRHYFLHSLWIRSSSSWRFKTDSVSLARTFGTNMARIITPFLLTISLLGLFQQPELFCQEMDPSQHSDTSHEDEPTESHAEEDDDCGVEWDCQDCQICHRSLAVVAFIPFHHTETSLPNFFSPFPTLHLKKTFQDTLLDPPRADTLAS